MKTNKITPILVDISDYSLNYLIQEKFQFDKIEVKRNRVIGTVGHIIREFEE